MRKRLGEGVLRGPPRGVIAPLPVSSTGLPLRSEVRMPHRPHAGLVTAVAVASAALSFAVAPSFAAPTPPGVDPGEGPIDFPVGALPARDVVVNVTLGANDPVRDATVVARDDITGRVVSKTTTTGSLGYAVVRMLPMQSNRRITITATGGTSAVVGRLSPTGDALAATVQRADADAAIEVNVNPATTIQAAYLDIRPGATLANSEKTVARRLGLTPDIPLDQAGRYSRVKFSGEAFAKEAEDRGGIDAYADWAAQRIAGGTALPTYAAAGPRDDLPLREGAPRKRENSIAGSLVSSFLAPLAELGGRLLFCEIGVTALCPNQEPPPVRLPPEVLEQFNRIEQGINNLQVKLTTVRQDLNRLEAGLIALSAQVQSLSYQDEMTAVDDVVRATATAAGLRAQGRPLPDSTRRALENALRRRQQVNNGCPNFRALVGQLPSAVVSLHPNAACTREGFGVLSEGLMQHAQRATAARLVAVAAGQTQGRVDAAGEYWLGELARNTFSSDASSAFAVQAGISTRDAATVAATGTMFRAVIRAIDADATGTYFGARIPTNQVLSVAPANGSTLYGIGTYRDPGNCRGGRLEPVVHRFMQGNMPVLSARGRPFSSSFYLPGRSDFSEGVSGQTTGASFPAAIGWVACTEAQLMRPPPPAPGTPAAPGWQSAASPSDGVMRHIRGPLRAAALCQVQQTLQQFHRYHFRFRGGADLCVARSRGSTDLPDSISLYHPTSGGRRGDGRFVGVLPNLQVSVRSDQCRPWEIGTSPQRIRSSVNWQTPRSDIVTNLDTAVGMQCPVIDLTPNAPRRDGWNCVSTNPLGRITRTPIPRVDPGWADGRSPERITSSLPELNLRSMGGYCPNWGWQPMPTGSTNISQQAYSGRLCSPGLAQRPIGYFEGSFVRAREVPTTVAMPCAVISGGVRLQNMITYLTTYLEPCFCGEDRALRTMRPSASRLDRFRQLGIGDQAPNWTTNNGVAGDFVVGPLYTSNAVGAFVPGLSPGGPVAAAPPRTR